MRGVPKSVSTKVSLVADERIYFTDSAARRFRMVNRERGVVHDDAVKEIDSVNSAGAVQLESIVSASHRLGVIDSSQESELVMSMYVANYVYIYISVSLHARDAIVL